MSSNIIIDNSQMINSMHHDIQCIESLDPKDKGTSRQFWFSASMLADIFGITRKAVAQNVEFLLKWNEVTIVKNFTIVKLQNSVGAVKETQLYDLTVFNKLAMQLRTDAAMEIRSKFSDILVEVETTGSYGIQLDEHDRLLLNAVKAKTDAERIATINALDEYNNRQLAAVTQERDHAIKTKSQINDKRTASLMGKTGALTKENTKLKNKLQDTEEQLETANTKIETLEAEREIACLGLYHKKEVAKMIKDKYSFITYADTTLVSKVDNALKAIALAFGEKPISKPNPKDSSYPPMLYYSQRIVDQLFECIERDSNYLKSFK